MTKSHPQKMTLVVARYNESLDWLKKVPWDYVVYNKGKDNLPKWIENEIKLPNIGREAHTYLTYIFDNYHDLPNHSVFVQGNPFDHSANLVEQIKRFDIESDFFSLTSTNLSSHSKRGYLTYAGRVVDLVAKKIFVEELNHFSYPKGAQFIISNRAILFHTKLTYQKIIELMLEDPQPRQRCLIAQHGRACSPKDCEFKRPLSAWTMERLWKVLFDTKHYTIYD